jgi:hypothetical protein
MLISAKRYSFRKAQAYSTARDGGNEGRKTAFLSFQP